MSRLSPDPRYFTPVAKTVWKCGLCFFPRDHRDFDVLEAGCFEKLVQLHFAEAEPVIGVKFARPLEAMAEQIENHDRGRPFSGCDARAAIARSGWIA